LIHQYSAAEKYGMHAWYHRPALQLHWSSCHFQTRKVINDRSVLSTETETTQLSKWIRWYARNSICDFWIEVK
jgi:hypothetical protein